MSARVARIDAVIELLVDPSGGDRGSLVLALRLVEKIAYEAPAHVTELAASRPGAGGLGVWMLLLSRVAAVSSDSELGARFQRASVSLLAAPMKPLRVSLREVRE